MKDLKDNKFFQQVLLFVFLSLTICLTSGHIVSNALADEVNIEITNPSFDGYDLPNNTATFLYVPEWIQEGNGGSDIYNVASGLEPQSTNGENVCRLFSYTVNGIDNALTNENESGVFHYVYQTPLDNIQANTEYTLTFDVGNPAGGNDTGVMVSAYLVVGNSIYEGETGDFFWSQPLSSVPDGYFLLDRKVTFRTSRSLGSINSTEKQPLNIVFVYQNENTDDNVCMSSFTDYAGNEYCYKSICYIDNIRLQATSLKDVKGRKF